MSFRKKSPQKMKSYKVSLAIGKVGNNSTSTQKKIQHSSFKTDLDIPRKLSLRRPFHKTKKKYIEP